MLRRSCLLLASILSVGGVVSVVGHTERQRVFRTKNPRAETTAADLDVTLQHRPDGRDRPQSISSNQSGALVFSLQNVGDEALTVESPPPEPFGPLVAAGGGRRLPLWHDAYETTDGIEVDGEPVGTGEPVSVALEPGTSIDRAYELRHGDLVERLPVGVDDVFEVSGTLRLSSTGTRQDWSASFRIAERERYE